jgi:LysM repeat protein
MIKAFENSCFKGCLVYLAVLVALLVLGAAGLGTFGARLGLTGKPAQSTITTLTTSQQRAPDAPAQQQPAAVASTPTPQPFTFQIGTGAIVAPQPGAPSQPIVQATVIVTIQPPQITIPQVQPGASAQPPSAPAQAQGISGQATTPFYIVQGGDTLWAIAIKFDTTVDALKAANHLNDTLIKPNQLLYLPPSQPEQQPQPQSQLPPAQPPTDPAAGSVPSMPNTGINTHP